MLSILLGISLFFTQNSFAAFKTQPDYTYLAGHAGVISQIKSYFLPKLPVKTKTICASQTDAQWQNPAIKKEIVSCWPEQITRLKPLIDRILEQERALADTYYVFYHAQEGDFRVVQDITKALMARMNLTGFSEFAYLRSPNICFDKQQTVEDFIDATRNRFILNNDVWNDHESDLREKLVSVNISLFGNYQHKHAGECTFQFFLTSSNIANFPKKNLLKSFFKEHDFDTKYISDILNAYETIRTTEGNLLQVFVPKNKVDECAYLSEWRGTPYRKKVIPDCYDARKQRHTKISPLLDAYKRNSALFDSGVQARLLITSNTFLNPDSGIKIVTYSSASDKALKTYQNRIEELATEIIAEKINRSSQSSPLNTLVTKIRS